jgi:hypothetical protein
MFDENYKTNIKYYTVPIQLNCFGQNKIHYFLTLKRNQKIDS